MSSNWKVRSATDRRLFQMGWCCDFKYFYAMEFDLISEVVTPLDSGQTHVLVLLWEEFRDVDVCLLIMC